MEAPAGSPTPAPNRARGSRQVIGPFTVRHLVSLVGTLVGVGLVLAFLTMPVGTPAPTPPPVPIASFFPIGEPTAGLAIGQAAPELQGSIDGKVVGLTDLDGRPVTLAALKGRPVWINFWASWCPPCQTETPVLRQVFETHRAEGLALIAVSVQETSVDDVRAYAERYDLGYTIGFDATSAVFKAWQGFGLPTHYFLDAHGIVRTLHYGPLSVVEAERILAPLLSGPDPTE